MKNFTKRIAILFLLISLVILEKTYAADIVSNSSGNWSTGGTWVGGTAPVAGDNVFIASGHNVTVDGNFVITDIHLCIDGGGTRLTLAAGNTLQVSGKLRAYTGVAPGANSSSPPATIITTGVGSKIQFIGTTRTITNSGEWGANPRNYTVEFALNTGQEGTFQTSFKAGDVTVVSGIMTCNGDLRVERGSGTNTGTIAVQSGAVLRMASNSNIQRVGTADGSSQIGSLTVENGGTLEYSGATVGVIGAATITFNGTVSYTNSAPQTLVTRGGNTSGANPNTYNNLTLQASTKTLSQPTTVNGILEMRTGSTTTPTLDLAANTLTYGPSAILQYRGPQTTPPSQTTGSSEWPNTGSGLSIPSTVAFFNSSGVTLNANKTTTTARLMGGVSNISQVTLNGNNLSVDAVQIPSQGSPANKWFITNSTGTLWINNVGNTATVFPIGPSTALYHPATITNLGTADNFSVRVSSAAAPCAATNNVLATWDISEAVAGGSNCTLSLDYTGAATDGGYNASTAKLVHCNGTIIDGVNGSVTGTIATGAGFTSFSPFGISNDLSVLPVQLTFFKADAVSKKASLTWATTLEEKTKGFEIQRSTDGVTYQSIGFVNAKGAGSYQFYDLLPAKGNNLYRLRIIDIDGKQEFSSINLVKFTEVNVGIHIYPSLATDKLFVIRDTRQPLPYVIVNAAGQQVQAGIIGDEAELPLKNISKGLYILKTAETSFKFFKQ